MTTITPSHYQEDIFRAVKDNSENLFIEAVAGSGKTTTLLEIMRFLPNKRVLFCAFNKSIANELAARVPEGTDVATLHSLGFRALRSWDRSVTLDDAAVRALVEDYWLDWGNQWKARQLAQYSLKVLSLAKNSLTDVRSSEALSALAMHYDLDENGYAAEVHPHLPRLLGLMDNSRYIGFDDMIWRPASDARIEMPRYDVVMVDETQDLNGAQLAILLKMHGARIIAVGDRSQSIYGFRGADPDAIPRLVEAFNMRQLPLSITYRCPTSHVAMAKNLVPHLEARAGAPAGRLVEQSWGDILKELRPKTLVLCRCNAPLVERAYDLIRAGVPCMVKGRDIGANLVSLVKKLAGRESTVDALLKALDAYDIQERARLDRKRAPESKLQSHEDKIATIRALTLGCEMSGEVVKRCSALFGERAKADQVVLSSVHRAKGLEAERVVILAPWLMPMRWAKQAWEQLQERNIQYVAWTRSKNSLVMERKEEAQA